MRAHLPTMIKLINSFEKEFISKQQPLRVGNVYRNRLDLDKMEYFELFENEFDRYKLDCGDILVVEGNGSKDQIGRAAIWRNEIENCVHQNHIIRCRPFKGFCTPEYLMYFLNSLKGIEIMMELSVTTAGLYSLSTGKLKNICIPIPPLPEQEEIVRRVDKLFALADKIEERYNKVKRQLERAGKAIYAKAFRGEL